MGPKGRKFLLQNSGTTLIGFIPSGFKFQPHNLSVVRLQASESLLRVSFVRQG
jgi:hypothetical protein